MTGQPGKSGGKRAGAGRPRTPTMRLKHGDIIKVAGLKPYTPGQPRAAWQQARVSISPDGQKIQIHIGDGEDAVTIIIKKETPE